MDKVRSIKEIYETDEISNLKQMIENSAKKYSKNIAFKYKKDGEMICVTYEKTKKDIDALGTKLIKLGLKNKKISIIGSNSYSWCVSYLATVCGTGIVVPLDKALTELEIQNLIVRSKVEAIFFDVKYMEIIKNIKKNAETNLNYLICFDEINDNEIINFNDLIEDGEVLLKNNDKSFIDAKINEEEMNMILFTSGTTSLSKGVMLSHKNLCSNVKGVSSVLKFYPEDNLLSFLPIHHTLESTVTFLGGLYSGATLGICEGIKYISQNLIDYEVSILIIVPLILESIYKKFKKQEEDVNIKLSKKQIYEALGGKLRLILVGAAAMNKEALDWYRELNINAYQGYGLTETSPVLSLENIDNIKYGSIGCALPGVDIKIDNVNDEGIGEILAKGPNLMLGYFEDPTATIETFKDGWFCTGDLGYVDEDGFLFISGRKKSVIVLKNGKNVFPEEIEMLFNVNPYILETIVHTKLIKNDEMKLCAKIVINKDACTAFHGESYNEKIAEIIEKMRKEVNAQLPLYKFIREIEITDIPLNKTTTGKIKRY